MDAEIKIKEFNISNDDQPKYCTSMWLLVGKIENWHSRLTNRIPRCVFLRLQIFKRTCNINGRNEDKTHSEGKSD